MKKFFALAALCLVMASTSFAQKGTFYVGGGLGFNSGDANTNIRLAPEVGTWLADDIQVGGVLQFETNSDLDAKSRTGLIAYGRKWVKAGEKFSLYYGLMVDFHSGKNQNDTEFDGWGLNLDAGFAYALSEKWAIAGRAATLGMTNVSGNSSFGLNVSNAPVFNLGLYYTL